MLRVETQEGGTPDEVILRPVNLHSLLARAKYREQGPCGNYGLDLANA